MIDAKEAEHVLHSLDLRGPSLLFAAGTGVLLFASSMQAAFRRCRHLLPLSFSPCHFQSFWACHSPEMTQFWESLAEALHKKTGIQTAAFNADYNSKHNEIAESNGINGFPTIQYSDNRENSPIEYIGARDPKSILSFLHQVMSR
jgi:hypothetical protein